MLRSKPVVPRNMPLIAIGYKYNARKVLSFIVTDNAGIEQEGIPYLSKNNEQFTNVVVSPVARTLVMSKFFSTVNDFDSYNKSRKSVLALDKFWVTQCCWLQLCMTVAMGTTITNCWKLFFYGVKRDH